MPSDFNLPFRIVDSFGANSPFLFQFRRDLSSSCLVFVYQRVSKKSCVSSVHKHFISFSSSSTFCCENRWDAKDVIFLRNTCSDHTIKCVKVLLGDLVFYILTFFTLDMYIFHYI